MECTSSQISCLLGGGEADDERALGGGGRQDQVPDAPLARREGRRQAGRQRRLSRVWAQTARPGRLFSPVVRFMSMIVIECPSIFISAITAIYSILLFLFLIG